MNSAERHKARRARREAKREAKRLAASQNYTLENVADVDILWKAVKRARKGVGWKASVQKYCMHALRYNMQVKKKLLAGESIHMGFHHFILWDNGKLRNITSTKFEERIVDKAYTQVALVPALTPSFVHSNTANTKDRGTAAAHSIITGNLVDFFRKHGTNGYILLLDFSNFFGSLVHEHVKSMIRRYVYDPRLLYHMDMHINACGDGSVGLGLGSEPNQTCAVAYPSRIDHYVIEMCNVFAYGRYMDDIYVIDQFKEKLQWVYRKVKELCRLLGLTLNPVKVRLVKLSHGFTFLKRQYYITKTGRIVRRPSRSKITGQRRKMKRLKGLMDKGEISYEQIEASYKSWEGAQKKVNSRRTVFEMHKVFVGLFKEEQNGNSRRTGIHDCNVQTAA